MARRLRRRRDDDDDDGPLIGAIAVAWSNPKAGAAFAFGAYVLAGALHLAATAAKQPLGDLFAGLAAIAATLVGLSAVAATIWRPLSRDRPRTRDRAANGGQASGERMPYRRRGELLSKGEWAFYGALVRAAGPDVTVFAKVRLGDLLDVPTGTRRWRDWHRRVAQKHVDFVLCAGPAVTPFLLVELDDRSHARSDRVGRDAFVDAALRQAGWPLERVPAQAAYDVADLAERVRRYLTGNPTATTVAKGRLT